MGLTFSLQFCLPCIEDAQEIPRACFKEELLANVPDAFVLTNELTDALCPAAALWGGHTGVILEAHEVQSSQSPPHEALSTPAGVQLTAGYALDLKGVWAQGKWTVTKKQRRKR